MNPCELTAAITALANLLAARMTVDQLNMLGVVLTQLGDTLFTIATQRGICETAAMPASISSSDKGMPALRNG